MRARWSVLLSGAMAVVATVAVACGPGAEPGETPSTTQSTPRPPTAGTPSEQQPPNGGATQTSVSGKPLDPNARFGGVLIQSSTTEGPTFSTWEEAAGIAPAIVHKMSNMIVQYRTWGDRDDYANQSYFEIHPDLAHTWEQSPDGLTWTFRLRDGITWSDGVPLTCADAKWSLDTIRTGEGLNRSPRSVHFLAIDEILCPDDLTMEVRLKWPKPAILETIALPYNPVRPKHAYENDTDRMRAQPPDPSMGAFLLREWIPGEKYVFERNPDYWDQPFPYLDGVEVQILPLTAQRTALRGGRLHFYGFTESRGGADALVRECQVCQFWEPNIASGYVNLMANHERQPWNSQEVMDAISLAVDRQKLADLGYDGWLLPPRNCGLIPGTPWALPEERCSQIPGYNIDTPEENKERARQILRDAGYAPGDLQVTVRVWITIDYSAPTIIEDLNAVGIVAEAEMLETARAYDAWSAGDFDIGLHGFWTAGLDPDFHLYEQFYTGSDRNYNRYSNPEYDRLVDLQSQTLDVQERQRLVWDAWEMAIRDHAKFVTGTYIHQPIFHEDVRGFMPAINYFSYGPHHRFDHVWLDEE